MASTMNGSCLPVLKDIEKARLDSVVAAIQTALSADSQLRHLSARAVQAHVWHHYQTPVADILTELRAQEEMIRTHILQCCSLLVYAFHEHAVHVTLARAGVVKDDRIHAGSSLSADQESSLLHSLDLMCLDAKERIYMLLKLLDWLPDFFRRYPMHFYENSFAFVDNIPAKTLRCKIRVVGLGIAGSMALSGLAKYKEHGLIVQGYEKRAETGPRSATSRYQNASWRAYNVAQELVDDVAYQHFLRNRQRFNVTFDNGITQVRSSDRVQIILGSAVQSAIDSARRYGADIRFNCQTADFYTPPATTTTTTDLEPQEEEKKQDETTEPHSPSAAAEEEEWDIVALFCGAQTVAMVPGLEQALQIHSWPQLDSECRMWLRVQPSAQQADDNQHGASFCVRGGQVGAEQWDFTIHSTRSDVADLQRVVDNLTEENAYTKNLAHWLQRDEHVNQTGKLVSTELVRSHYQQQKTQALQLLQQRQANELQLFDYIFTNAPLNPHNLTKRAAATNVVLEGGYTVEVKLASQSTVQPQQHHVVNKSSMSRLNTTVKQTVPCVKNDFLKNGYLTNDSLANSNLPNDFLESDILEIAKLRNDFLKKCSLPKDTLVNGKDDSTKDGKLKHDTLKDDKPTTSTLMSDNPAASTQMTDNPAASAEMSAVPTTSTLMTDNPATSAAGPTTSTQISDTLKNGTRKNGTLKNGKKKENKITTNSNDALLQAFHTKLLVCGGDACVPPNPQAAYGATLACEAAASFVHLAVSTGHLNSILHNLNKLDTTHDTTIKNDWIHQIQQLQLLLNLYYEAHAKSENYFQWVQTLISNTYSLPPFV